MNNIQEINIPEIRYEEAEKIWELLKGKTVKQIKEIIFLLEKNISIRCVSQ
jgi:hypothetical protein